MSLRYGKGTSLSGGTTELEQVRLELVEWRRHHRPPTPIPMELWAKAAELAGRHGLGPTARRLGLDYAALKRRSVASTAAATFVELLPPVTPSGTIEECALEVESGRGARMRVVMKNVLTQGLASIIRDFVA